MGEWFGTTFGAGGSPWWLFGARRPEPRLQPSADRFVCLRCGTRLVPCDACGLPAMCGDAWCQLCQPDG